MFISRSLIVHDRVQNSSGSGLYIVEVTGSGLLGFEGLPYDRVYFGFGFEKIVKTRRVFGFPGLDIISKILFNNFPQFDGHYSNISSM